MNPKNKSMKNYRYAPSEGYESRRQSRLKADLGMDESAAEAILRLHSQVVELQARIRILESELAAQQAVQDMRLRRYRETYEEATWIEIEF